MIPFREALDLLLQHTPVLGTERCRIEEAVGRVLRQEIRADRAFPSFDRVMMDGYALRSIDLGACASFRIAGSAPAGAPTIALSGEVGACVEVMTGAPLPSGADCIVPVEEITRISPDEIRISPLYEFLPGKFIHRAGSDAAEGEVLMEAGRWLGSREIGVAASCGAAWIEVARQPLIRVLATGDELVAVDEVPAAHQIRQSNAHAISSALRRAGHAVAGIGTLGDDVAAAREQLEQTLVSSDWLVLTGAVSKGARDFIPGLLDSLGCQRIFHGIAQRPGKPAGCWIGPTGQVIVALPGNPVSALTGLHAFVLPALGKALGVTVRPPRMVVPDGRINGLEGMTLHLPVVLGEDGRAQAAPSGNSGDFIGLLRSDGFITLPPRGGTSLAFPFTPWL